MILRFLGCGGGFSDSDQYQSNCAIEVDDKLFLIDCGSDLRFSLKEQYPYINNGNILDYVKWLYISHLHGDHCHGAEWLGFCTYFGRGERDPISLMGNPYMLEDLWNYCLKGTMGEVVDQKLMLPNYFNLIDMDYTPNVQLPDCPYRLELEMIPSYHIYPYKFSFGLFITTDQQKTYFTSDVNIDNYEINEKYYHKADRIFHDCETYDNKSGVHYHYEDLKKLPEDIKSKMCLYHYDLKSSEKYDPYKDGFIGWCYKGDCFGI